MPESVSNKLYQELDQAQQESNRHVKSVEPTADEIRNGWNTESLTAYLADREAGQSLSIDINSLHRKIARRPVVQNSKYSPLRWRK